MFATAVRTAAEAPGLSSPGRAQRPHQVARKPSLAEPRLISSASYGVVRRCGAGPCDCAVSREEEQSAGTVRRSSSSAEGPGVIETVPPVVREALDSPGHSLSGPVERRMEAFFGRRLGSVRVHDGDMAGRAAVTVNSRAFAI